MIPAVRFVDAQAISSPREDDHQKRRFSIRQSSRLSIAVVLLAMAATTANAQGSLNITASASDLSPQWVPVPDADPENPTIASTLLSATVNNPPTAPYPCTAVGPVWGWTVGSSGSPVQYSPDGSTWSPANSGDYSAWIVQPDQYSSAATLNVRYFVGGYWYFPCVATAIYTDGACGDTWRGTATALPKGTSVELISLTVVSGATQANVIGATNWAKVLNPNSTIVKATTKPDNADGWAQIQWTGGSADDSANQRKVIGGYVSKTTVTAQIGGRSLSVNIWRNLVHTRYPH